MDTTQESNPICPRCNAPIAPNEKLCDACKPDPLSLVVGGPAEPELCTCCNEAYAQGGRSICNACAQRIVDGAVLGASARLELENGDLVQIARIDKLEHNADGSISIEGPARRFVGTFKDVVDDDDDDAVDPNEDLLFSVLNESRVNAEQFSTSLDEEIEHAQDAILYLFNRLPGCGVECLRAGKHVESCQRGIVLDIMSGDRNAKGARI